MSPLLIVAGNNSVKKQGIDVIKRFVELVELLRFL